MIGTTRVIGNAHVDAAAALVIMRKGGGGATLVVSVLVPLMIPAGVMLATVTHRRGRETEHPIGPPHGDHRQLGKDAQGDKRAEEWRIGTKHAGTAGNGVGC